MQNWSEWDFYRRNISARRSQAVSVVVLLFLGVFATIAVGLNRIPSDIRGAGGFAYFTRTILPVANSPEGSLPMRVREGARADCFNLNHVTAPEIWGIEPTALAQATFPFVEGQKKDWSSLDESSPDGAIPAIADAAVIQWILKKKIGEEITVTGDDGATHSLRFVAALDPSIFQGAVVISDKNFRVLFPNRAGYRIFLSHKPLSLDRYGSVEEMARVRLARFLALQNSYLFVFFQLSMIGLILGLVGALLTLLRNFEERRVETHLLEAIGFSRTRIVCLYRRESLLLAVTGIVSGALAGLGVVLVVRGVSWMLAWQFLSVLALLLFLAFIGAHWIARRSTRLSLSQWMPQAY